MRDDRAKPTTSQTVVSTGIAGLDNLLCGGLPADRLHLIQGRPGAGKTTLALQFLLEGARRGERGVYVTLSETSSELRGIAASHGWSLDNVELCQLHTAASEEDDRYTLYHPAEIELGEVSGEMLRMIDNVQPTRVALDSLSELRLLSRDALRYRRQILALKQFFAGRTCTVLLIDDHSGTDGDAQLESLAHGVIRLDQQSVEYGIARRRIEIVKMRGVPFVGGYHDATIRTGGLAVFPRLQAEASCAPPGNLAAGVQGLDDLLGGGLSWGTVTLITGPAGTGKTTVASQYLASALAAGYPVSAFLFDERHATFVGRAEALGLPFASAISSGQMHMAQIQPGSFVAGEFADRVRQQVEDRGARLVLIDTINGFLAALPGLTSPVLRLYELLTYLNEMHVATVLVMAQQGILGAAMPVPLDISYIADTVVLLRFFEASGAVHRAISVVKKRTGPHESTIRELQIGPDRLRVGAALTHFQGVLTGVPSFTGGMLPDVGPKQP
jgi:circadian clock protein KaiC